jgi:HSP20 family protein
MSTLTLWDARPALRRRYARPYFADFVAFDTLARRAFGIPSSPSAPSARAQGFVPAAEVVRDGEDALVRVEIPGIDAEKDVAVEVNEHRLVIKGERRDERSRESGGHTVREVRYGSFRRSFTLPEGVSADAVTATYDAGVLNVRVAGAYTQPEAPSAQRIEVTSGASNHAEPAEASEPAAAAENAENSEN